VKGAGTKIPRPFLCGSEGRMDSLVASNQFKDEVTSVVKRYAIESDLSALLMVGVLEAVKHELLQQLQDSDDEEENEA